MLRDRRPLPLQVRDEILSLIAGEGLRPGDRLPAESELAERFGVGRTTAREALKLLEQDGVIDVRHGAGRFVSHVAMLERPITRLESVTELMRAQGYSVANEVVSCRVRTPDVEEAADLALGEGEQVIRLERVRRHEGEPLIFSVDVFPRRLVGGRLEEVDWSGSLLELLEAHGTRVTAAVAQVQAVRLPPAGRRAIGVPTREPWILLVHRNVDENGRAVILSRDYYRGDRFTFSVLRRRS